MGQEVVIAGWVQQVRQVGRQLAFWVLRDRSGWAQVVASDALAQTTMSPETVVRITGRVVTSKSQQGYELQATQVTILAEAAPLPFELHQARITAGAEQIFNHRVLSLRHRQNQAVFRIKATIAQAFRSYLIANDFQEIQTPKIVATGTEGGAELFQMQYFDRSAFLAQSPQFYKQMLACAGFERVFEVGPVFRAESHDSSRHTNEFSSLDLEMAFIDDEAILMDLETELLRSIFAAVTKRNANELQLLGIELPQFERIPRLTLAAAQTILRQEWGHESPLGDLNPAGEKLLCQYAEQTWGIPLVFVTDYPSVTRPFYALTHGHDPSLTRSFDLLFRGVEITTGGLRIHDHGELVQAMQARGLDPETYAFYLQAFTHGAPPHGGLAIGLERLTARMLQLDNLRQATFFPRDRQRLVP